MAKQLTITSPEISSLAAMDSLFENYCQENGINLDFSKSEKYNAYLNGTTAGAFIWFIQGVFRAIGKEHVKGLEGLL